MTESDSIFGVELDRLRRLLTVGEAEADDKSEERTLREVSRQVLTERPGMHIGRYRLLSILGEGGMGVVYLAEQVEPIKRQVALKVIKPGMDSARVIARFEAERQALALLDHPNIARVFDAGTTEAGRPYFAMERVEGLPITEYCDEHKLTIEQRLKLFQQVCNAVQHAHQKGIIHRDIKPSNILVAADGDKAIPKIIDFGVAKAIAEPLTERTLKTEESRLLGTPEYMSPEQADMATEDIDTRSDVYSLGVLLYVLLTGTLPFDAKALREHGIEHVRRTIRETDPKTPSTQLTKLGDEAKLVAENRCTQVGTLARRLRSELEWIPLKAMRKERSERYRSASELADDVENYLRGVPLLAGPPGPVYRFKKSLRRHAVLWAATLAVAVALMLGMATTMAMYLRSERALTEAQAITQFLTQDVLRAVNDANDYEQSVGYVLDAAAKKLDEGRFKDRPLVEATIRGELGWTYRLLGQLGKAEQQATRALQICEQHLGETDFQTTQTMFGLGLIYAAQNRWNDAYRMLSRQLRAVQRGHPTEYHAPYIGLGMLFAKMGQYRKAEECYLKKIEIVRRIKHVNSDIARAYLANVYYLQGRYKEAEQLRIELLDRLDPNDRSVPKHTGALADIYRDQGRYQEAEELYKTTMEKQHHILGPQAAASTMGDLAHLYTDRGDYQQADEMFRQAYEILAERGESWKPTWYTYNLAVLRTKQGRLDEAQTLLENVRYELQQAFGEIADDHPEMLKVINGLGVLRREQRRHEEAEALLRQALAGREQKLGRNHPACLESKHELALLYIAMEEYEKAEPLLLDAYNGREAKLGPEHPHALESLKQLVTLYESWPNPDEAAKWRAKLPRHGDAEE